MVEAYWNATAYNLSFLPSYAAATPIGLLLAVP